MAALPELAEDVAMTDVKEEIKEEVQSGTHTPVPENKASSGGQQGGGGGGKKKKKGKK